MALHDLRTDPAATVVVGRDHAWIRLSCMPSPTRLRRCSEPLERALRGPPAAAQARAAARQALLEPELDRLLAEVHAGLMFEAHPYGHPTPGRLGVLDQVRVERDWRRITTMARVVAADARTARALAQELEQVLAGLSPEPPPDAAMKGPPSPGHVLAHVPVDGEKSGFSIGLALARPATDPTRMLPDDAEVQVLVDLRTCLAHALDGLQLDATTEAPPGWPAQTSLPVHGSLRWSMIGSREQALAQLTHLRTRLDTLSERITPDCAARPELTARVLQTSIDAGHTAVIALPSATGEDPALPDVHDMDLIHLPPASEALFR